MKEKRNTAISVKFKNSRQGRFVNLDVLINRVTEFLEYYFDPPIIDIKFKKHITGTTGRERFESLMKRTGFTDDPEGFFTRLVRELEKAKQGEEVPIRMGSVVMPYHLLLAVLEVLIPGSGVRSIKTPGQLEELTNIRIPVSDRQAIESILDIYPVRFSMHTIRQMRLSKGVARQYAPFTGELDEDGEKHTWVGQFFRGIVEQMYRNRVIFIMNMSCPVYCRFCFRKHKECRNQTAPTQAHVKQAVAYIKEMPDIKEIVLTGGDPFMNKATLRFAIQELSKVPHIKTLRIATRAISYFPDLFLRDDESWLRYLLRINLELTEKNKRIEVATHFVHPDEISVQSLDIITQLASEGIQVYVQTPFIAGCNDDWKKLSALFHTLHSAGAEMHYIFLPTSPIQGNKTYWSPLSKGLEVYRSLRMYLSDRAMPHLTTATCIGKMDWNSSGWAVERHADDPRYIWLRTPYDPDYYTPFAPIMQVGMRTRINDEGTLDASFMSEIGDETLFAGHRTLTSSPEAYEMKLMRTSEIRGDWLESLIARQAEQETGFCQLDSACGPAVSRSHYSRAEIDIMAENRDIENAVKYIHGQQAITDIIIWCREDPLNKFQKTLNIIDRLSRIPHISVIRIRSLKFIASPSTFTKPLLANLALRNQLRVIRPCRIEIEIEILHSSQIRPEHARLCKELRMRGITVYNNTPLLGFINDNERDMLNIANACREAGIEFTNLIIAGTPIQKFWNEEYPIDLNAVIDIATNLRRYGSGREIPRYLIRTELGEVDFSIAPRLFSLDSNNQVLATLRPYNMNYYRSIDPYSNIEERIRFNEEGYPVLSVNGVSLQLSDFLFDTD